MLDVGLIFTPRAISKSQRTSTGPVKLELDSYHIGDSNFSIGVRRLMPYNHNTTMLRQGKAQPCFCPNENSSLGMFVTLTQLLTGRTQQACRNPTKD